MKEKHKPQPEVNKRWGEKQDKTNLVFGIVVFLLFLAEFFYPRA